MEPGDCVRRILEAIDSGELTTERFVEATRLRLSGDDGLGELLADLGLATTELANTPTFSPGPPTTEANDGTTRLKTPDGPTLDPDKDEAEDAPDAGDGTSSGRYEVEASRHARGGIGEVWRARDRRLDRTVAIKRLRPDRLGLAATRIRFRREAKITAKLQHPGVVPVFDLMPGGPEGGGGPWYTMRFVEGKTLAKSTREYHEAKGGEADLRRLVEALIAVCQTIAYAHAGDVLHRDLKGDNVILGDFGEVFVLDWGLAKQITGPDEVPTPAPDADDPEITRPGSKMGTPAYMAPEVARAEPSTKRSDIYSLGAILYAILAGRPPYQGTTPEEIVQSIELSPPTPPVEVNARAPRSLDAICRKAMAREPSGRYATAGELADDLRRWLDDRPVSAYDDPWTVRLARWMRKHRTAAASAAAVLVAIALSTGVASILLARANERAAEALVEAGQNFGLARDSVGRLIDTMAQHNLPPIAEAINLRRQMNRISVDLHRNLLARKPHDRGLALDTARAEIRAGDIHRSFYETIDAEAFYQQASDRLQALLVGGPSEDHETIRIYLASGLVDRADLEILSGRPMRAIPFLDEADRVIDPVAAGRGNDPIRQHQAGRSLLSRAAVCEALGRLDEASSIVERSRDLLDRSSRQHSGSQILLLFAQCHRAELLAVADPEEARRLAERNVRITRANFDRNPGDSNLLHLHAVVLHSAGQTLLKIGDREAAADCLVTARDLFADLTERSRRTPRYLDDLAEVQRQLGVAVGGEMGVADLRTSIAYSRELIQAYPTIANFRADLGLSLAALSAIDDDASIREEARRLLDEGLEYCPGNPEMRRAREALGPSGGR